MPVKKEQLSKPAAQPAGFTGSIAESIMSQIAKAGQPRVTTRTTEYPEEPMNMMNLGLITMMLLERYLNKNKTTTPTPDFSSLLTSAVPGAGMGAFGSGTASGQSLTQLDPMQLLTALRGGFGDGR